MRHGLSIAVAGALLAVGGCASPGDHSYEGEGLGTVDGAYYDAPRDYDYAYYPSGGYYYQPYPYYYGGGYGRYHGWDHGHWDHDHDHGHDHDHDGGGHGDHDRDHGGDHHGGDDHGGRPSGPDQPTYNDMRAGKLNPHIHENAGGNRVTRQNGGTRGAGGGGRSGGGRH